MIFWRHQRRSSCLNYANIADGRAPLGGFRSSGSFWVEGHHRNVGRFAAFQFIPLIFSADADDFWEIRPITARQKMAAGSISVFECRLRWKRPLIEKLADKLSHYRLSILVFDNSLAIIQLHYDLRGRDLFVSCTS